MLNASKLAEAQEMAELYRALYVLENSLRALVNRVMSANIGLEWWKMEMEVKAVYGKFKIAYRTPAARMKQAARSRPHPKGSRNLFQPIGFDELAYLITGKQDACFTGITGILRGTDVDCSWRPQDMSVANGSASGFWG